MHQHFEPEDRPHRSPHRGADSRYWDLYCRGYGIDPEIARSRYEEDEPLFYTSTRHDLDFTCQCRFCVKKHTLTMGDRDFLKSVGIVWKVTSPKHISHVI
jgi:hypothetical protein